jgi:hypothetical protein
MEAWQSRHASDFSLRGAAIKQAATSDNIKKAAKMNLIFRNMILPDASAIFSQSAFTAEKPRPDFA